MIIFNDDAKTMSKKIHKHFMNNKNLFLSFYASILDKHFFFINNPEVNFCNQFFLYYISPILLYI